LGTRTIAALTLNAGTPMAAGTYGSTASPATNKNDACFSGTGTVTIVPTTTATSVTSSLNPATAGASVTFTATVSGGTPTGNVTFHDGATSLGTSVLNGSFQAFFSSSILTAGTHNITAQYAGNANHAASTSTLLSQVILLAPYAAWAADPAQGLTAGVNNGPLDDPNRDGLCNLLVFALGGAPMSSSLTVLPKLTRNGSNWIFEYDWSDLSLPVTAQVVEYGSDLTGWTAVAIPATTAGSVTITPGSPFDHVSVTLPNSGGNGFVRLKISQ
jgi:hypothetical protein